MVQGETGAARGSTTAAATTEATAAATMEVTAAATAMAASPGGTEAAWSGAELAAMTAEWDDADIDRCIIQAHYAQVGYAQGEELAWLYIPEDWPQGKVHQIHGMRMDSGPMAMQQEGGEAAAGHIEVCTTAPAMGQVPMHQLGIGAQVARTRQRSSIPTLRMEMMRHSQLQVRIVVLRSLVRPCKQA